MRRLKSSISESEDVDDEGNPIAEDGSGPDGSRKRFKGRHGEVVKKVSILIVFCNDILIVFCNDLKLSDGDPHLANVRQAKFCPWVCVVSPRCFCFHVTH